MMRKNEFVGHITVEFKYVLQPQVLFYSQSPAPLVACDRIVAAFARYGRIGQVHGVLERIDDHEKSVSPYPGIIVFAIIVAVFRFIDAGQRINVCGIEWIVKSTRGGEVRLSGLDTADSSTKISFWSR